MEWVEFTARTVAEAKELALDRLMVDADDAEFEVLEEPKAGLFGRMRGEARVRARVRPAPVRQKIERRDRRRGKRDQGAERAEDGSTVPEGNEPRAAVELAADDGDETEAGTPAVERGASQPAGSRSGRRRRGGRGRGGPSRQAPTTDQGSAIAEAEATVSAVDADARAAAGSARSTVEHKEHSVDEAQITEVGAEAQRFLNGLVEAFGIEARTELAVDGNELEVTVEGENLGLLVGPRGLTLQAIQDLTRVASQRRLHDHDTRLRIDIGGYRKRRSESLARFVTQVATDVTSSGVARVLDPMSSADRKVIHDALSSVEGIVTRSEGEEPFRRVVIAPASAAAADA